MGAKCWNILVVPVSDSTMPPQDPSSNTGATAPGVRAARSTESSRTLEPVPLPDLLNATPTRTIDGESTDLALVMAFAGGTSGGLFSDALAKASIAPSTWEPASFADDLFLKSFVSRCFQIRVAAGEPVQQSNYLRRLLSHPPSEPETVFHRRAIVEELHEQPELRGHLEALYRTLCRFRSLLEGTDIGSNWDSNARQLDLLRLFRELVEPLSAAFGACNSGLRRLANFGGTVQASEPFGSLCDLLQYDEQLATLSFEIGIGADGRIRRLQVRSIQETRENPFVSSPWRRWLTKLELFARGYRFSDGEVMARLLDAVFEGVREPMLSLVQLLGDVEFYLGALSFCDRARKAKLDVCLPELGEATQTRTLTDLFNPLLLGGNITPIAASVHTDRMDTTVLVTGPNSGGKTRLLQALGLAQMLAQCGLYVPARSAKMALVPGLVVSLIQETTLNQSEGRLGTELVRIRALFEDLPPGAMVILDELCSGTNPSEGEEIFELVIRMLTLLKPQAFVTTHFLGFAARLQAEAKIEDLRFLQVLLDENEKATYQFGLGVASTSLAAHAAARLGVTGEQLLALIEQKVAKGPRQP